MEWAIPPEIWALAGVVLGTFTPSALTFFTGRQQANHEANKALIEALERRIGDLETRLRDETSARRTLEAEVRRREEEAHSTADRARLAMSVAVAHINRLAAHIEAGSPPPPPEVPPEVADWVSAELWTSKLRPDASENK